MNAALYDLSPVARMLCVGVLVASGPLLLVYLRNRRSSPLGLLQALTVVTLFLAFDLVLFGAFTRLTDSGLGCPDWPGCYGNASPIGASAAIDAAQQAMPTGPVTPGKAWVEMVHRYFAEGVGLLALLLAVAHAVGRWVKKDRVSTHPWWALLTAVWVGVQGGFGALTVTMRLFPAIVTLHLLGGYVLLALLTVQVGLMGAPQAAPAPSARQIPPRLGWWVAAALLLLLTQALSGAWVSTNYAVLVCADFPGCQGTWWPQMDFAHALEVWRPLGLSQDGGHISFQALTAIHYVHRLLAVLTLTVLATLAWYLSKFSTVARYARALAALLALQLTTGISNVVLDWPMLAAVLHTGGAGAMVVVLTRLLVAMPATYSRAAYGAQTFGLRA